MKWKLIVIELNPNIFSRNMLGRVGIDFAAINNYLNLTFPSDCYLYIV